jgi:hypothetical protein
LPPDCHRLNPSQWYTKSVSNVLSRGGGGSLVGLAA